MTHQQKALDYTTTVLLYLVTVQPQENVEK